MNEKNRQQPAYMNWSGGKDSSLALNRVLKTGKYKVECLLTSVNAWHNRVSMHGLRRELLERQAAVTGIPLETIELPEQPGMEEYEEAMRGKVLSLKDRGYTSAVFGDIFLEDLKKYREDQLAALSVDCVFPLWKNPTIELVHEFIGMGFKAIIVCVNESYLDPHFCGRLIDDSFLRDLPPNVDPCGENGEYHSFVFEAPFFKYPVPFQKGGMVQRSYSVPLSQTADASPMNQGSSVNFSFLDLLPES